MKKKHTFLITAICLALGFLLISQAVAEDGDSPFNPDPYHWLLDAEGKEFILKDNPYFPDLKIVSSEEIHLVVDLVVTNCLSFHLGPLENSTKTETVITISGLAPLWKNNPNGSYWKYQDGYLIEPIANNGDGKYAWTQDLSEHHVYLQPQQNTLYIGLEVIGKPPPPEPPYDYNAETKTYTLTENITEPIVIVADFLTLDGNGAIVSGPGYGLGIYFFERNNVAIKNCIVQDFSIGISDSRGNYNTFTNNTVLNISGLSIFSTQCSYNTFVNNTTDTNTYGIVLQLCSYNTLTNNTAVNSTISGFYIFAGAENNTLTGNTANNNQYGITLWLSSNNTLTNNTVLNIKGGGIRLSSSSKNTLSNNTANNSFDSICLTSSSNNTIINNTVTNDTKYGIVLFANSNHNILVGNTSNNNRYNGIHLASSSYNTLINNTTNGNGAGAYGGGIYLADSSNNLLTGNTANNNSLYGIYLSSSSNNTLINNTADLNIYHDPSSPSSYGGIFLMSSNNNTFTDNTVNSNDYGLYLPYNSVDNIFYHNNIYGNITYNVWSNQAIELSHFNPETNRNEGNFWGRTTAPFFIAGEDSNALNVVDSFPYGVEDGWEITYPPGVPPDVTPPEITIISPAPQDYLNLETIIIDFTITDAIPGVKDYQVYLDDSQFLNGVLLDQGVQIHLINLLLGEHTLRIVASDKANNQGEESVTFRSITATEAVTEITTDIRTILEVEMPDKAREVLEGALEILIGENEGKANNGALDKLADGDLIAAFIGIWRTIKELKKAEKLGAPPTTQIQQDLCNLTKEIVRVRLAKVEAIYGVDHPKVVQIRDAYNKGIDFYNAGDYANATKQFRFCQQWIAELDKDGPIITFISPRSEEFLKTRTPEIWVIYTDELTAISTPSVRIWIDGIDYTASATITAADLKLIPPALAEGSHTLTVSVNDDAEPTPNNTTASITFSVDIFPPDITIALPPEGATLTSVVDLNFAISYTNTTSGVDISTLKIYLNDEEIQEIFEITADRATYYPEFDTIEEQDKFILLYQKLIDKTVDQNRLLVTVYDKVGNQGEARRNFYVDLETIKPEIPFVRIALRIISGDEQEGLVGRCAEIPLVVQAYDEVTGRVLEGIPLSFVITQGGGIFLSEPGYSTVTNAEGKAGLHYHYATTPGINKIEVSVLGDPSVTPVEFTLKGYLPDLAITKPTLPIQILPGALPEPLAIEVTDPRKGNIGVKDVEVRFDDVTSPPPGKATEFLPTSLVTDANGKGETGVIIPYYDPTKRTLKIYLPEFINPDTGEPLSQEIEISVQGRVSLYGNGQIGTSGKALENPLRIYYYPAGTRIIFTAKSPGGLVDGQTSVDTVTDANGEARVMYTFGTESKPQIIEARINPNTPQEVKVYFAAGPAEVELVRKGPNTEQFADVENNIEPRLIFDSDGNPLPRDETKEFFAEVKAPLGLEDTITCILNGLDSCGEILETNGVVSSTKTITLTKVETTERYALYRSKAIQSTTQTVPEGYVLPFLIPTDREFIQGIIAGYIEVVTEAALGSIKSREREFGIEAALSEGGPQTDFVFMEPNIVYYEPIVTASSGSSGQEEPLPDEVLDYRFPFFIRAFNPGLTQMDVDINSFIDTKPTRVTITLFRKGDMLISPPIFVGKWICDFFGSDEVILLPGFGDGDKIEVYESGTDNLLIDPKTKDIEFKVIIEREPLKDDYDFNNEVSFTVKLDPVAIAKGIVITSTNWTFYPDPKDPARKKDTDKLTAKSTWLETDYKTPDEAKAALGTTIDNFEAALKDFETEIDKAEGSLIYVKKNVTPKGEILTGKGRELTATIAEMGKGGAVAQVEVIGAIIIKKKGKIKKTIKLKKEKVVGTAEIRITPLTDVQEAKLEEIKKERDKITEANEKISAESKRWVIFVRGGVIFPELNNIVTASKEIVKKVKEFKALFE